MPLTIQHDDRRTHRAEAEWRDQLRHNWSLGAANGQEGGRRARRVEERWQHRMLISVVAWGRFNRACFVLQPRGVVLCCAVPYWCVVRQG